MDIDHIVILAAGRGSRLGGERPYPKALAPLTAELTILDWQLIQLRRVLPLTPITVVVGYGAALVQTAHPDLRFVVNSRYAEQNTAKSLLLALQQLEGTVLWLNGDVVFGPHALPTLLTAQSSCMLVNNAAVGEEEVKYRTSAGFISELSKEVHDAEGEALGINIVTDTLLPALRRQLAACAPMDYFEKAIQWAVAEGASFRAVPVAEGECIEVDFPEDLLRARALVQRFAG